MRFIILLTFWLFSFNSYANEVIVKVAKIVKDKAAEELVLAGKIKKDNTKDIYSSVGGKVSYVNDKLSDLVSKDTKIFSFDEDIIKTKYQAADVDYNYAKYSYDKDKLLYQQNVISEDKLYKSKARFHNAIQKKEDLKKLLNDMVIEAEEDLYVTPILHRVDDIIRPGDYLFSIIKSKDNNHNSEMLVKLPGQYFNQIKVNDEAFILENNEKYIGSIESIGKALHNGGFEIKILFNNKNLIHNEVYNVTLLYNKHDALYVPLSSILTSREGSYIYLVNKNNIVEKLTLDNVKELKDKAKINGMDLKEGDTVMTDGMIKVLPGDKVKILNN